MIGETRVLPDVQPLLDEVAARQATDEAPSSVPWYELARESHEANADLLSPPSTRDVVGSRELLQVAGPDNGTITAAVYRPTVGAERRNDDLPTLVWLHGGGWVSGSIETADTAARALCASGYVVVVPEYRRAPESPFPAALEDARAVVEWAALNLESLGGADGCLTVGGDSAGASLAMLTVDAVTAVGIDIAAQLLVYPVADLDTSRSYESRERHAEGPFVGWTAIAQCVGAFLGDRGDAKEVASPLKIAELVFPRRSS